MKPQLPETTHTGVHYWCMTYYLFTNIHSKSSIAVQVINSSWFECVKNSHRITHCFNMDLVSMLYILLSILFVTNSIKYTCMEMSINIQQYCFIFTASV